MTNSFRTHKAIAAAGGFLSRLAKDKSGNVLYIIALALLPVTAMLGAGVDTGRAYMVRARIQSACDAGALATRKALAVTSLGTNTIDANADNKGKAFFRNNFTAGQYGTTGTSYTQTLDTNNQVNATAITTVPYTFNLIASGSQTVTIDCAAKLDLANTDIMFVLDNSGSMSQCPDGTNGCGGTTNKIAGLRSAILSFYDTVDSAATKSGAIMRYGFVPYDVTVNIRDLLYSTNPNYLTNNHAYASVAANMTHAEYSYTPSAGAPVNGTDPWVLKSSSGRCATYASGSASSGGPPPAATVVVTYSFNSYNSGNQHCVRNTSTVTTTYTTGPLIGYSQDTTTPWIFGPTAYDTSAFKAGTSVTVASITPNFTMANTVIAPTSGTYNLVQLAALPSYNATYPGNTVSSTASGCVEEANTVAQATYTSIPSAAYDMRIDHIPDTTDAKQWRPKWPEIIWNNSPSNPGFQCLQGKVQNLTAMSKSDGRAYLNSYLQTLQPHWNTYHDSGMIWGGRLISPTGLFSALNTGTSFRSVANYSASPAITADVFPAAPTGTVTNGYSISSRHLIFMTDGYMCTDIGDESLWGYEQVDQRVMNNSTYTATGCASYSELDNRHNSRFLAICNDIKAHGITIWAINFGTGAGNTVLAPLQQCSTNNGQSTDYSHSFYASDTATLTSTFTNIASQISLLKLSQ
jgi:Flp pilus assembly protein TadG